MAEGTSAPSYRLSQGTQQAVALAGGSEEAQEALTRASGAELASKEAIGIVDRIQEKQDAYDTAIATWENNWGAYEDRSSWATGEFYDQFRDLEKAYQEEYVEAVRSGDTKKADRLLKDQEQRFNGLGSWNETMDTAFEIQNTKGGGWSNEFMKNKNNELDIINALTRLDGKTTKLYSGKEGEMVFDIELPDGSIVTKTRREIDEMIANGVKPTALKTELQKEMIDVTTAAEAGEDWNEDTTYINTVDKIDKNNISDWMNEPLIGKRSFVEDFISDANLAWQKPIKINSPELLALETTEDGVIDKEEWNLFLGNEETRRLIAQELQNQPDIAKHYVAEWYTGMLRQNVEAGKAKYDKAQAEAAAKGSSQDLTTYQKNKLSDQRDYQKIIEARKKPLIVNNQKFELITRYMKDADGDWAFDKNPLGKKPMLVKLKDKYHRSRVDLNALIAEIERLQFKTDSKKSSKSATGKYD